MGRIRKRLNDVRDHYAGKIAAYDRWLAGAKASDRTPAELAYAISVRSNPREILAKAEERIGTQIANLIKKIDRLATSEPPRNRAGLFKGGIAMRPMLAQIAERGPEAVIPLAKLEHVLSGVSRMSGMGGAPGSGMGGNLNIYGDVYGFDDFADKVGQANVLNKRIGVEG